jgi:transposase
MVQAALPNKQPSIMVWAAICGSVGRSELIFMKRDAESPGGGYTAQSYIQTLREGLLPFLPEESLDLVFQQDNSPLHTAKATTAWLAEKSFKTMIWPAISPDLNPIEHCWAKLKEILLQLYPEIDQINTTKTRAKLIMREGLEIAWKAIKWEYIFECLDSMPQRVGAVIKAKGWYTKY